MNNQFSDFDTAPAADAPDDRVVDSPDDFDDIPEFGLVDVIEAFTAMRHEWRGQTREGRELAAAVAASTTQIQHLENRLAAQLAVATSDEITRNLVNLIVDIDAHLSRAVEACAKYDKTHHRQQSDCSAAIRDAFEQRNFLSRWLSRPLLRRTLEILNADAIQNTQPQTNPSIEGLLLVVSRLRRMMAERNIKRLDFVGKPFDAETMNAVSVVESTQYPAGHVVEELSPAYLWRDQLLRFADVRVSK
ncbi:MAG TPA: nucleotide exchange factor GrpE [Planctomycetaceae bacterium]|nr:nucleotide exchange factor GrpE [Planctomycetaceae bacterium]HQZ67407.1 nucleotide exchange factor GrpE [Planctomycetaceae bacterium]